MSAEDRTYKPVVDQSSCNSCSICQSACPGEVFTEMRKSRNTLRGIVYDLNEDGFAKQSQQFSEYPPCQEACPLKQDIRSYIKLISERKFSSALDVIRQTNPLPLVCGYVCHRPCEDACIKKKMNYPVPIRILKKFVAGSIEVDERLMSRVKKRDIKVAIIGSGPAGLTVAYDLATQGIDVDIFESQLEPGGMLHWAIPDFRLPREVISREIALIKKLGVKFHTGIRFGRELTFEQLKKEGFGSVIIATGTMLGAHLSLKGDSQIIDCLDFLRKISKGETTGIGETVLVIGGGNAAVDTARKAIRLGAKKVQVVYRRRRQEMPADQQEVDEALKEGIQFQFLAVPFEVEVKNNKVTGLKCLETHLVEDPGSSRLRPISKSDSEFVIETDTIISAIGQRPDFQSIKQGVDSAKCSFETATLNDQEIVSDLPGLYFTGDFANGSSTIVEAMASGRKTAKVVLNYLKGKVLEA